MFFVISAALIYSLLSFGAVQPSYWYFLIILWSLGITGWLLVQTFRSRRCNLSFVFLVLLTAGMFWFLRLRLAPALIAAPTALWAAGKSDRATLRFFRFLVIVGILEALLGLVQFFVSPGWIFGYINPYYRVSGTLINRNHFAGLLEMLIPVVFGLAYISGRRFGDWARIHIYLLAGAFMATALLFSVSRMGIFSFLCTTCFLGVVLQWRQTDRGIAAGIAVGMIALVAAGALWIGVDVIVQRYSELVGDEALAKEGRLVIFGDAARMIMANPLGVGPGNFQDRFRRYQTFRPDLLFDHAHNDYLETAAEWGIPIAAGFWILILFTLIRAVRLFISVRSPGQKGILLACSGAIFSILIHSLTDFNLQIPSNAILFFTFVGISLAQPSMDATAKNEI